MYGNFPGYRSKRGSVMSNENLSPNSKKTIYMYFCSLREPSDDFVRHFREHLKKEFALASTDTVSNMTYLGSISGLISFVIGKIAALGDSDHYSVAFFFDGSFPLGHDHEEMLSAGDIPWSAFGYLSASRKFCLCRASEDPEAKRVVELVADPATSDSSDEQPVEAHFVGWECSFPHRRSGVATS